MLVRAKVERANEHLRDLEKLARGYRDARIHAFVGKPYLGPSQMVAEEMPRPISAIPIRALTIAGDAFSNLRAALDHLAWQLVDAAGRMPNRSTGFPIFESLKAYECGKAGKVHGMSHDAVEAIDRLKPYKGGNDALWRIHYFDNVNKHRMLFRVGAEHIFTAEWLPENTLRIEAHQPDFPGFLDPNLEQHVDLAIQEAFFETQVAHGDALIPSLHQLVQFVFGLVEGFGPLLGGE